MKWMIASDLHGSAYYCKKMLEAYDRENAQRLLLLGDILYHGPRNDLPKDYAPKDVIAMLNARKADIYNVRGNCDTEVDQMVLEFPVLTEYLLIPMVDRVIFATHGHIYNENTLPPFHKGDILLHGHTHVPVCADRGDYIYMNPGSLSMPKEDSWHSYMILEQELSNSCHFTWKDLDGEVKIEFEV